MTTSSAFSVLVRTLGFSAGLRLFPVSSRFLRSLWLVTHLDKQYYCMPGIGYQYSAIISIIRRYIHELVYFEVLNISSWIPRTWYSYCIVEFSEFSTDYKNFSCEFDRQSGWYLWSIHPSLHPSIPPSIHPSIHPPIHPCVFCFLCGHVVTAPAAACRFAVMNRSSCCCWLLLFVLRLILSTQPRRPCSSRYKNQIVVLYSYDIYILQYIWSTNN